MSVELEGKETVACPPTGVLVTTEIELNASNSVTCTALSLVSTKAIFTANAGSFPIFTGSSLVPAPGMSNTVSFGVMG